MSAPAFTYPLTGDAFLDDLAAVVRTEAGARVIERLLYSDAWLGMESGGFEADALILAGRMASRRTGAALLSALRRADPTNTVLRRVRLAHIALEDHEAAVAAAQKKDNPDA